MLYPDENDEQIRILHVDDNPELSGYIESFSEKKCFSVVSCKSDQEALELLRKESFDVIVAEHRPPTIDGIALLGAARDRPPVPHAICFGEHWRRIPPLQSGPTAP